MWTRSELKERAKAAFKRKYWKCVLVAFLLALLVGGGAGSSVRRSENSYTQEQQQTIHELATQSDFALAREFFDLVDREAAQQSTRITVSLGGLGIVGLVLSLMVFNPLIVGCRRFFLQNSWRNAELKELGAGFKDNWGTVVLTMFLKNLFLFLWALLLVVPAIIKAYSYRLVPYILEDHPELSAMQAINLSRKMMNGHKADAFVLDLSFLGWILLSALTAGILHIFYVGPYIQATDAELYKAVSAAYASKPGA